MKNVRRKIMHGFIYPISILYIIVTIIVAVVFLVWTGLPNWLAILLAPFVSFFGLFILFLLPSLFAGRKKTYAPIPEDEMKMDEGKSVDFILPEKPVGLLCPSCDSSDIAVIVYGLPAMSKEMEKAIADKKITLGGCMIYDGTPQWICNSCGHKFGELRSKKGE